VQPLVKDSVKGVPTEFYLHVFAKQWKFIQKPTYSWARITCIISCNQIHENDENIWMSNLRSKSLTWKASTNLTHLNDIGVTEFICLSSKSVDHLYSLLFRISFQLSDLVIPWCDCISCILQPSLNTISTNPWLCWTKFPKILLAYQKQNSETQNKNIIKISLKATDGFL